MRQKCSLHPEDGEAQADDGEGVRARAQNTQNPHACYWHCAPWVMALSAERAERTWSVSFVNAGNGKEGTLPGTTILLIILQTLVVNRELRTDKLKGLDSFFKISLTE